MALGGPGSKRSPASAWLAHEIGPAPVVITHGAVLDREYSAATASSSARSCETSRTVPGKASSAASSASRLSRSRWFVGSSRTRRFVPDATMQATRRRRSPPESAEIDFSWASQPEKRNCPSSAWACGRCSPVTACVNESSTRRAASRRSPAPRLWRRRRYRRAGRGSRADAVSEPVGRRRPALEDRVDERRLAASVRPDETDVIPALERERDVREQPMLTRRDGQVLHLDHRAAAARRLQELEAKSS